MDNDHGVELNGKSECKFLGTINTCQLGKPKIPLRGVNKQIEEFWTDLILYLLNVDLDRISTYFFHTPKYIHPSP